MALPESIYLPIGGEFFIKEKREADFLMFHASQRYQNFLEEYPGRARRIQQQHLAGYLGISPGSYQPSMVLVIGICGMLPVMNLIVIAINPVKYKANMVIMMVFSFFLFSMYLYLVLTGQFPVKEVANIIVSFLCILLFAYLTPWRSKNAEI